MKISRNWLQTYFDAPLPTAEALGDALTFHAFEIEEIVKVGNDDVIDVKVTPNRGHDALSHRAIAKEISAILNLPLKNDPLQSAPNLAPTVNNVAVTIGDLTLCPRYIAGYIKGVSVAPSPTWLKEQLEAIGQRSINNIVDATNYVMFNLGQPLHAFDAGQLAHKEGAYSIEVRNAVGGEILLALDDKEYKLIESNVVIADTHSGKGIGIAGVKGGKPAGITESTRDIIIESANFDGVSVRRTAKSLNLATDASQRFQQVISPELAAHGMRNVVDLILQIAGGELVGFTDVYPSPQTLSEVTVSRAHTARVLGMPITSEDAMTALIKLGLNPRADGDHITITVPFERLDLHIAEDVIEEIGRIIGYEKVTAQELPPFEKAPEINQNFAASERVREDLTALGYSEVHTSVFAEKGERAVLNKVDGARPFLRANLSDGLTEALKKNIPHKDLLGLTEVKLFEIGTVWRDGAEEVMVGLISEKQPAAEESLTEHLKIVTSYEAHPLSMLERYQSFSRYPSITRDIALWVPSSTQSDYVKKTIQDSAGDLMVRIDLFDEFQKGERTSFGFRLVFQSFDRTLTDSEANAAMDAVYEAVKTQGWEVR